MAATQDNIPRAIYLSLGMIFMASTAMAATKFASGYASTFAIVTVQYAVSTSLALPMILRPGLGNLHTRRPGLHLFRSLVGVLGFVALYAAIDHIPLVDALLLRQSAPLWVPLVVWAWHREGIAGRNWLPLLVGFAGVIVILRPSPSGLSLWHAAGMISAVTLAASMVATGVLARTEPPARILFYTCAISLACVAPFGTPELVDLPWQAWLAMVYIGVAIYFTLDLYTRAYGMAPAAAIAPINYLGVVLTAFWGWLFWHQVPDRWTLFGSVLVIAGGLLTVYLSRLRPAPALRAPVDAGAGPLNENGPRR